MQWYGIDDSDFLDLIREISQLKSLQMFILDMDMNSISSEGVIKSGEFFRNGFKKLKMVEMKFGRQFIKTLKEFEFGINYSGKNYLMKEMNIKIKFKCC